ncbi:MAG: cardiolipin synthase [Candidatus Coproplasma sp.]
MRLRLLKQLFSKFFIVALLLILQVALIVVLFYLLNVLFAPFIIVELIIGFIVILYIINKDDQPEFKVPWLILILTLPLVGVVCYLLFANPRLTKKQYKRLFAIHEQTKEYVTPAPTDVEKLKNQSSDFYGIDRYLNKNSFMCGHFNNRVTYFKCGEEFFPDLLAELEKAQKFIFMEYFILAEGEIWDSVHEVLKRKADQGVEIRILYDDIGTSGLQKTEYYRTLRKEGIKCYKFHSFHPFVSGVYNYRDHRKITVIDGKVGYTGGINIGDEYANIIHKFGYWKDTAIKIEGPAVTSLSVMFLQLYDLTAKCISDYPRFLDCNYESFDDEGYVFPFGDGPKPYYNELIGENNFINMINAAKRYVYITTPYLITDYTLTTAIKNAAYRGVDVRIIVPHVPDKKIIFNITRSKFPTLMKAGVKVYEYTPGFIHAKSVLVDDEIAFVGTINFDYRSLVHHFECGAVMYNTPCIKDIKEDLEHSIAVSTLVTTENYKQNGFVRLINSILAVLTPML